MRLENLLCWRCQGSLDAVPQPFARAAECPHCNADLHVCKLCRFFDAAARRGCKEPVADEVTDKDRSNFCGYFEPTAANVGGPAAQDAAARSELESLFGLTPGDAVASPTSADAARSELEKLFGQDDAFKT